MKYTSFGEHPRYKIYYKKYEKLIISPSKKDNVMLQKIRQKEIEKKYKLFFSNIEEKTIEDMPEQISKEEVNKEQNNIKSPKSKNIVILDEEPEDLQAMIYYNIAQQIETDKKNLVDNMNASQKSDSSSIAGDYHLGKPYTENFQTSSSNASKSDVELKENDGLMEMLSMIPNEVKNEERPSINNFFPNNEISLILPEIQYKTSIYII